MSLYASNTPPPPCHGDRFNGQALGRQSKAVVVFYRHDIVGPFFRLQILIRLLSPRLFIMKRSEYEVFHTPYLRIIYRRNVELFVASPIILQSGSEF